MSGLLAVVAVCRLFSTRSSESAVDIVLQGLVVACVCVYLPWAWAGTRGVGQLVAVAALLPVGVWIVALWMLLRLMYLTSEQIVAYRLLAGSFLCFVGVNATLAVAAIGRRQPWTATRSRLSCSRPCFSGAWRRAAPVAT